MSGSPSPLYSSARHEEDGSAVTLPPPPPPPPPPESPSSSSPPQPAAASASAATMRISRPINRRSFNRCSSSGSPSSVVRHSSPAEGLPSVGCKYPHARPPSQAGTARASHAEGGNRTHTPRRAPDFESGASTSSATSASYCR